MKTLLLIIATVLFTGQLFAQNQTIKPGVRTTFHAVDEKGKPISEELIEVEVTFSKTDANGNKVPVYSEKFTAQTTKDGYFQREIAPQFGDQPTVTFGKYSDVDFKDPNLCVRVDFRRIEMFNAPWIIGKWAMLSPVPLAAESLKSPAQTISKTGDEISLSSNGGTVVLNDDDPTNELQILDFDEQSNILYLDGGNSVDLSSLAQFTDNGSQLTTDKTVVAGHITTTNGHTDIEEGKISMRYDSGQDGIEMGVDDQNCTPFMTFIDCEGNILGSIRMGPEGFKFYQN